MLNFSRYLPRSRKLRLGLLVLVVVFPLGAWRAVVHYRQRSYVNVLLGCTPAAGVAEAGFQFQEYDGSEPFRWTSGTAKLLVPIDAKQPPQCLWIRIETFRPKPIPVRFQVLVDDASVFNGSAPPGKWEKVFDLSSRRFSEHVMIELRSDTFVPKGVMDGGKNTDTRALGVQVKGIMLQRDEK